MPERLADVHLRIPPELKAQIDARADRLDIRRADLYRAYLSVGDARDTRRERQKETKT